MNGTIPIGIFQPNLIDLGLARNQFTGTLPTQIGLAVNLQSV
jgi:hypothetical protein